MSKCREKFGTQLLCGDVGYLGTFHGVVRSRWAEATFATSQQLHEGPWVTGLPDINM